MPSAAYWNFLHMRKDVLDLIGAHYRAPLHTDEMTVELGYLMRSAIVMLCAAWERYNEDILIESISIELEKATTIGAIPIEVQKRLSQYVMSSKNELEPIQMADMGWKHLWKTQAVLETDRLNTPNRGNLNKLFQLYFGLPEYSRYWTSDARDFIDELVRVRGEIAHNGNQANPVTIEQLRNYQDIVVLCVIEIDDQLGEVIRSRCNFEASPWQGSYPMDLERPIVDIDRSPWLYHVPKWT